MQSDYRLLCQQQPHKFIVIKEPNVHIMFSVCAAIKLGGIMDRTMIPSGVQTAVQVAVNAHLILFLE